MNKKGLAITQSTLLILGIIAFAFIVGGGVVSASDAPTCSSQGGRCVTGTNCASGYEKINAPCTPGQVCCKPIQESEKSGPATTNTRVNSDSWDIVVKIASGLTIPATANTAIDEFNEVINKISGKTKFTADTEGANAILNSQELKDGISALPDSSSTSTSTKVTFFSKFRANFWKVQKKNLGDAANPNYISTGGYILQTAAISAMSAVIITQAFKIAGTGERNMKQINTAAWTSAAVVVAAASTARIFGTMVPFGYSAIVVVGATLIWAGLTYQEFAQEVITYNVGLWQPAVGGKECQKCNTENPFGCSEYQCRSYGAGCVLLNSGTKYEQCDWNNSRDLNPPLIAPLKEYLDINFDYERLSNDAVKLIYTGQNANERKCIPAFTGVKFAVKTNEPAQCKIDLERKFSYDEMSSFLSEGSVYTYNHTISIPSSAFPSQFALNEAGFLLENGLEQNFYLRCQDANGNTNPTNFLVTFCIDEGPDTTAPEISTNYMNNAFIRSGVMFVDDVMVYTNEPAECKWDNKDVDYERMEYNMTGCSKTVGEYLLPNSYQYGCYANLTGIRKGEVNNYYIRCKDKPLLKEDTSKERRIENEQSYVLSLRGTNPLAINSISLNEKVLYDGKTKDEKYKIIDSTTPVKASLTVKTTQGAEENGNARCAYRLSSSNLFYEFYNKGIFDYLPTNTNDLYLNAGNYNYTIRCCDLANNCANEQINFEIETDTMPPEITRTYYEDRMIKLITNEHSECVYSLSTCNYLMEDGLSLETNDNLNHYLTWDTTKDLHIKCMDKYGNIPSPTNCQIIVRAYDEYKQSKK